MIIEEVAGPPTNTPMVDSWFNLPFRKVLSAWCYTRDWNRRSQARELRAVFLLSKTQMLIAARDGTDLSQHQRELLQEIRELMQPEGSPGWQPLSETLTGADLAFYTGRDEDASDSEAGP